MASKHYRIGVMFSTTGPYSTISRSMLNGALLGFQQSAVEHDISLEPVVVNPGGDLSRYASLCQELISSGIRHVVGCYTSSSRKEIIPYFEKHDTILWYPSHYEGFESSPNVIYTGASPNQHILPLVDFVLSKVGPSAYCVGSNYIWAWENNRVFREAMVACGGQVMTERYFPVGDTEIRQAVDAILSERPHFVFNNLIGTSAYAFFREFRQACRRKGINQVAEIPVASCSLSEPELQEIGAGAVDGHLTSSVYFSSLGTPESLRFTQAYAEAFPDGPATSADAEASYIAVKLLAGALELAGTDEVSAVKDAVVQLHVHAPQGEVWLDPATLHAYLTPRIGRSTSDGRFNVLYDGQSPVKPDPYLVHSAPRYAVPSHAPNLRMVK